MGAGATARRKTYSPGPQSPEVAKSPVHALDETITTPIGAFCSRTFDPERSTNSSFWITGEASSHVAIVGAGFVGTSCAFALLNKGTCGKVTLTDVNSVKCLGEVLDLEDSGGAVQVATPREAGQADIIVIAAGRAQREGETRLDLIKANSTIVASVVQNMQPIKPTAKIIVVSNPCDPLTFVAQEVSGLPLGQVFGSGTMLDSWRLRIALGKIAEVHHSSITLHVLGEHGDSQFPAASLASIGGVPLLKIPRLQQVNVDEISKASATKAYDIISKKGYTAFGVAQAVQSIVETILHNKKAVMPVSIRVPDRQCCLSLPAVVGARGICQVMNSVVDYFSESERKRYDASVSRMEEAIASLLPFLNELKQAQSHLQEAANENARTARSPSKIMDDVKAVEVG